MIVDGYCVNIDQRTKCFKYDKTLNHLMLGNLKKLLKIYVSLYIYGLDPGFFISPFSLSTTILTEIMLDIDQDSTLWFLLF